MCVRRRRSPNSRHKPVTPTDTLVAEHLPARPRRPLFPPQSYSYRFDSTPNMHSDIMFCTPALLDPLTSTRRLEPEHSPRLRSPRRLALPPASQVASSRGQCIPRALSSTPKPSSSSAAPTPAPTSPDVLPPAFRPLDANVAPAASLLFPSLSAGALFSMVAIDVNGGSASAHLLRSFDTVSRPTRPQRKSWASPDENMNE